MKNRGQAPSRAVGGRSSGPQGTRLFAAEDLRQYAGEAGAGSSGRASVREPVLEGSSAGLAGRRFVLRTGRQTIGRRDDNDIVVNDPSVSASHAWIINQQGHYVIMNTLSTNGTFVNDRRIHETTLQHGDRIRLGQAELVFLTREHGAPAPARLRRILVGLLVLAALGAVAWWLLA
ncbi:MAG: FHA domain-containing protein [Pseudomonadota bacterium]|nr:FHA domain-containing protein [Pseudomonadota bacterium]